MSAMATASTGYSIISRLDTANTFCKSPWPSLLCRKSCHCVSPPARYLGSLLHQDDPTSNLVLYSLVRFWKPNRRSSPVAHVQFGWNAPAIGVPESGGQPI